MLMQSQMNHVYTLNDFRDITFGGFDIKLPDKTIEIITVLAEQVGSPTYIKTPVFAKRELPVVKEPIFKKKRRANQGMESVCDEDWESLRTFQTTKIEQKIGIDAQFDLIRSSLNKITEKTYDDQCNKICDILDELKSSEENMLRVGNAIFEIASTNRFYSKLYADLYTMLIHKYEIMHLIFENNLNSFLELFTKIEYISAEADYDAFCKNNLNNEKRKALSMFFVNLSLTKIITDDKIVEFAANLLKQVMLFIHEENKKNEVDEMIENIAILYNKETFDKSESQVIDGETFVKTIEELAKSKAKNFQSLSNKAIFKCMDMVDM
jgi:hypothetical protein